MRLLIGIALAALLLLRSGSTVLALDPSLRISQHAHTAWTVRDGDFKDPISSIAQTPDGICGSARSSVCFASTESGTCSGSRRQASTSPASTSEACLPQATAVCGSAHSSGWQAGRTGR